MKKLIGALAIATLPAIAQAAPAQWTIASGGNGHYYEFVNSPTSWSTALSASASATPIAGYTAHLATSTSAAENAFMATLAGSVFYIAGTDQASEGTWVWAAGPEMGEIFFGPGATPDTYANWNAGEPNNFGDEDFVHVSFGGVGGWNDIPDFYQNSGYGYMVEYSLSGGAVPEPASWAMMIAGLGAVGFAPRRRRHSVAVTA